MSETNQSDMTSEVDLVIAEWFQLTGSGKEPDPQEFLQKYPQFQDQLRSFLSDYQHFRGHQKSNSGEPKEVENTPLDSMPTKLMSGGDTSNSVKVSTRFRELRLYKQGGLGILYAAIDESLHRDSVVKFLNDKGKDEAVLRRQFQIEAEITARLDHPGVVPVYGLGEDWEGRPFYVMRFVKGCELSQAIQEYHSLSDGSHKRRELFNLLEHLVGACNTVAYAHDVGIVHCDLKPANIMIGKYGETFVLDWGLAQSFERSSMFQRSEPTMRPRSVPDSNSSGHRGGTMGYISPEQVHPDAPIGPASDIYSLGATLYQILTGSPPFNGRDWNVIDQIQSGKFSRPREIEKKVSKQLEAICLKAMSLQPSSRYLTAKQMATDLNNWMRDDEVQAHPDGWLQRITRYSRRHRAVTAGALLSMAFFIVGAAWMERWNNLAERDRMLQRGLGMSLDKFEELCWPLANGEMNNLAVLRPISKSIAEYTTDYLKDFEQKPSMKPLTGRVYELKAIIAWLDSSDTTSALANYDKAEQLYRQHQPREASVIDVPRRIAQIQLSRGEVYLQRQEYDRAHQMLTAAADAFEQLVKQDPKSQVLLRELAEVYHRQGETYLTEDNIQKSLEFLEKSRVLREKLETDATQKTLNAAKRDLARSYGYLGDLYLQKGELANALKNYELSRIRRKQLFEANGNDPEHRFQYARGIANFGFYENNYGGDLEQAIKNLKSAAEIQKGLCQQFPEVSKFSLDLGHSLSALAEIYLFRSFQSPEAEKLDEATCKTYIDEARDAYSDYYNHHKNTKLVERGVNGLAFCNVVEAALLKKNDPQSSPSAAYNAETMLLERHTLKTLAGDELMTLVLAKALQNDERAAMNLLTHAIDSGENRIFRIESHRRAAFKTLSQDKYFDELCKRIKDSLVTE